MDLSHVIPDSSQNWIYKNQMIYYHKYVDIPILKYQEECFLVALDRRVRTAVIKMIKYLLKLDLEFYLVTRLDFYKDPLIHVDEIILNYIKAMLDPLFFDEIYDLDFDYGRNFTNFMTKFDCLERFQEPYEKLKSKWLVKDYDWWLAKDVWRLPREDMRNFLSSLGREVKLNLFF